MLSRVLRWALAGALAALALAAPVTASARATVTVQIAYGGFVAGGVSVFVYLSGAWELPLAMRDLRTSLLEVSAGRARLGVPLPSLRTREDADDPRGDGLQVDLVRWRF